MIINLKRPFRTLVMLLLIVLVVFGLASCRLPASKGPETGGTATAEFPVPGPSKVAPGTIDLPAIATQTALVILPVVISPGQGTPEQNPAYPPPDATSVPNPTATPITYVVATAGAPPATYTLQEGEYPFCIARRFNISQSELLSANNLTVNSLFYAGQELKLPQTGTPFDGERMLQEHPSTHKILDGETLYSIACDYGDVSPDMIALQNDLKTYDLPVGEVLIIP